MKYSIEAECSHTRARAGILELPHGTVQTPVFMPVATRAAIRAVHTFQLDTEVKNEILLCNTYHLFLRPGTEVLHAGGGIHAFMQWNKPVLTDSGGYQIFSLSGRRKITEEGVRFQSHIDGSYHWFTPENVIDIQRVIGADIMMAFDECPPYPCSYEYARSSMLRTHRWLSRCRKQFSGTQPLYGYEQLLFPIIQGSVYPELRKQSAMHIIESGSNHGYAIGGLSVGEPEAMMYDMVEVLTEIIPKDRPRYLMGVGTPVNLLENISRGVDMFDCVLPARNARHGIIYTSRGIIHIKNKKWEKDFSPLDESGPCLSGRTFSKAYVRHLFHTDEIMGMQVASLQNLSFFVWLMQEARNQIRNNTFYEWKNRMVTQLSVKL